MQVANEFVSCNFNEVRALSGTPSTKQEERSIRISPDYRKSTIWIRIANSAPPYISQTFLDELLGVCGAMRGFGDTPFRYRVLSSDRPGVFSLGGDLALFRDCILHGDRDRLAKYAYAAIDAIWESVTGSAYPDLCSIALVQGEAQGGGFEAALSAHVIVAEARTSFGFPECLFGLYPGMGAYHLLAARISPSAAKRIIGSANRYTAEELHEMGVIDVLAPQGRGYEVTREFIDTANQQNIQHLRSRLSNVSQSDLYANVNEWIDQAMGLGDKHMRTINYILQAQQRHMALRGPSVKVPSSTAQREGIVA